MTSKVVYKNNFALPKAATYDQEFTFFFLGEKNSLKRFQSFDSSLLYLRGLPPKQSSNVVWLKRSTKLLAFN